MMPRASSNAATPMIVEDTSPLALYSCDTANVADGSVGEAREPSKRHRGIKMANKVALGISMKKGVIASSPKKTARNANSASKMVMKTIPFPNFLIRLYKRVPPTENVIKERAIFVMALVCSIKFSGITWNNSGFNNTPAKMYPVIFGSFIFETSSPSMKPVNMITPMISKDSI